ncbi:hypothetical protein D3C80_1341510 [compost metagenome]
MAVGVVDLLEVIDIQQQEGKRGALLAGQGKFAVGAFEEVPAVTALGEHIGGGQALQLAFSVLLFGDVFGDTDHNQALVQGRLPTDKAFIAQPADMPSGVDDTVLTILHGAFDQHFGQAAFGVIEVVGVDAVAPLVVVGQQQPGRTPEDPFIGRADVDHLLGFPVERP